MAILPLLRRRIFPQLTLEIVLLRHQQRDLLAIRMWSSLSKRLFDSITNKKPHSQPRGHNNGGFPCPRPGCRNTCSRRSDIPRHILTVHERHRWVQCSVRGCTRTFCRKDKLDKHLRKDHHMIAGGAVRRMERC